MMARLTLPVGSVRPVDPRITARIQPPSLTKTLLCLPFQLLWLSVERRMMSGLTQLESLLLVRRPVGVILTGWIDFEVHSACAE